MGDVTAIGWLLPGSTVSVSGNIIRVETQGSLEYHDALDLQKEVHKLPEPRTFTPLLTVPADAPRPLVLIRGEMNASDGFDARSSRLIKQGAAFTTHLQEGLHLPGTDEEIALRCDFVYVLRESMGDAILLGVLMADAEDTKDNAVVAMLDLLGFSDIIDRSSLDDIERSYTQTLMSGLTFAGLSSAGTLAFDENNDLDTSEDLWPVSVNVFSDTVLLYPRAGVNSLEAICRAVALLTDMAIQADWLFRGAIDYGSFRALEEHNVYIGTAVTRAHKLEQEQDWAGTILGEVVLAKYPNDVAQLERQGLLVDYPVPFKTKKGVRARSARAVNWCYFALNWQINRREKLTKLLAVAPSEAQKKIEATIAFHDHMANSGLASKQQVFTRVVGDPTPKPVKRRVRRQHRDRT